MRALKVGRRVYVEQDEHGGKVELAGTVTRLCRNDDAVWVKLDERHELCPFPSDDPTRATQIKTFPVLCRSAQPRREARS